MFTRTAFLSFFVLLFAHQICASERLPPNLVYPHLPGFPCQSQAAHVYNDAILAVNDGHVDIIALRFVRNLRCQQSSSCELSVLGSVAIVGLFVGVLDSFSEHPSPYVIVGWILILLGNQYRYHQTYNLLYNALRDLLPLETFTQLIEDLTRDCQVLKDKKRLINLLARYKIDTSELRKHEDM